MWSLSENLTDFSVAVDEDTESLEYAGLATLGRIPPDSYVADGDRQFWNCSGGARTGKGITCLKDNDD